MHTRRPVVGDIFVNGSGASIKKKKPNRRTYISSDTGYVFDRVSEIMGAIIARSCERWHRDRAVSVCGMSSTKMVDVDAAVDAAAMFVRVRAQNARTQTLTHMVSLRCIPVFGSRATTLRSASISCRNCASRAGFRTASASASCLFSAIFRYSDRHCSGAAENQLQHTHTRILVHVRTIVVDQSLVGTRSALCTALSVRPVHIVRCSGFGFARRTPNRFRFRLFLFFPENGNKWWPSSRKPNRT